jgi:hypothetical protein
MLPKNKPLPVAKPAVGKNVITSAVVAPVRVADADALDAKDAKAIVARTIVRIAPNEFKPKTLVLALFLTTNAPPA